MANLIIEPGLQAVEKITVAESLRDNLLMVNHGSIEVSENIFDGVAKQKRFIRDNGKI